MLPSIVFDNPMDLEFGPDGALYVLEYGDGYFAENPDAQLARIDFVRGNRTPILEDHRRPRPSGQAPLTVSFSSAGTTTRTVTRCGTPGTSTPTATWTRVSPNPTYTFTENGDYRPTLKVTDSHRPVRLGRGPAAGRPARPDGHRS